MSDADERPLTVIERLLHGVYQHYVGDGMPVFAVRCAGPWDADRFRQALAAVQARHPLLRCRIVEPQRHWPRFQLDPAAPPIPLEFREDDSPSAWEQTALEYSERLIDVAHAPLCRFAVHPLADGKSFDLVAAFHHAIVDGLSMLALMQELLSQLAGQPGETRVCTEEMTFREMQPTTIWQRLRLIGRFGSMQIRQFWRAHGLLPAETATPGAVIRQLWTADRTTALLRRCRREQTTVYGAIAAAALQTVAEELRAGNELLHLQVPFDIRGDYAAEIDRRALGCFAGILDFRHARPSETEFWTLARRCRKEVETERSWKMPNAWDKLMSRISFTRQWLETIPRLSVGVNNLGRCDDVSAGPWRVEEFSWFGRSHHVGASVAVNCATINGALNLTWQGSRLSPLTLQRLGDALNRRLEQAIHAARIGGLARAA